jgi:hypothetical protein
VTPTIGNHIYTSSDVAYSNEYISNKRDTSPNIDPSKPGILIGGNHKNTNPKRVTDKASNPFEALDAIRMESLL